MSSFYKSMEAIGHDKNTVQSSLDRCRYKKRLIDDDVQYLYDDLYKYKKRLQRIYKSQFCNDYFDRKTLNTIEDYKIYPRGVRPGRFPLYTTIHPRIPRFYCESNQNFSLFKKYGDYGYVSNVLDIKRAEGKKHKGLTGNPCTFDRLMPYGVKVRSTYNWRIDNRWNDNRWNCSRWNDNSWINSQWTSEGERLPLERPASGNLLRKFFITSSGREFSFYSVA